ncbi:MAG: FHA domain-containing protein [Chloroflexi bacterium]|nr:FHA domain-containing protein [Chloroflexota bacterium]
MLEKVYQLIIRKGPQVGRIIPLSAPVITLGRDPAADITVDDPEVSRLHARLVETEEGYRLEDLGSTNGTFVAGRNISAGPILLEPDQEVQIGSGVVLLYQLLDVAEDAAVMTMLAEPAPVDEKGELLVTAVSATEPLPSAEPDFTDPMLPPSFDDLPAHEEAPPLHEEAATTNKDTIPGESSDADEPVYPLLALPDVPVLPDLSDLPELAELTPDPPRLRAPRVIPAAEPPVVQAQSGANTGKRIVGILAVVLLLLTCCCCGFFIFMYQWGGDWLLRQIGFLP